jgi:hypothetical protein
LTEETAPLTADNNEKEGLPPSRNHLEAMSGSGKRNITREKLIVQRSHDRTGLRTNPAQRIRPFRFGPPQAAHAIAIGEEKDSPNKTYGSVDGVLAFTKSISSAYDRTRSRGYSTTSVLKPGGSALIRAPKSSPVPSIPGNRSSRGSEDGIHTIVDGPAYSPSHLDEKRSTRQPTDACCYARW